MKEGKSHHAKCPLCRVARFFLAQYTKTVKIYQITTILPKGHKIHQMVVKYSKISSNIFSILRPSKIYPNWDFFVWKYPIWQPGRNGDWSRDGFGSSFILNLLQHLTVFGVRGRATRCLMRKVAQNKFNTSLFPEKLGGPFLMEIFSPGGGGIYAP
jgi:hypothetical protein